MNALLLLLCPLCASGRAQGGALWLLAGMIVVPYLVVALVVRAIRRVDAP